MKLLRLMRHLSEIDNEWHIYLHISLESYMYFSKLLLHDPGENK